MTPTSKATRFGGVGGAWANSRAEAASPTAATARAIPRGRHHLIFEPPIVRDFVRFPVRSMSITDRDGVDER